MKLNRYLCLSACVLGTLMGSGAELVKDGQACSVIVVDEHAGQGVLRSAADLQLHLEKITGARVPIVTPKNIRSKNLICVGESQCSRDAGYQMPAFQGSGYDVLVKGNLVVLTGPEKRYRRISSAYEKDMHGQSWLFSLTSAQSLLEDDCGPMHAVSAFLEHLGVRFYAPYEDGTIIPRRATLSVSDFRQTREAAFARRVFQYGGAERKDPEGVLWFRRLKCGSSLEPIGVFPLAAVLKHSFRPEWTAVDSFNQPMHTNEGFAFPRFTDPGFQRECAEFIRKALDANPSVKQLQLVLPVLRGKNDARDLDSWQTKTVYPQPVHSNIMTAFFTAVANAVKQTHPDRVLLCQSVDGNTLPEAGYRQAVPENLKIWPYSQSAVRYSAGSRRKAYLKQIAELSELAHGAKMQQHEWWNEFSDPATPRQGVWFMHALQTLRREQRPFISGVLMDAAADPVKNRLAEVPLTHLMYYVNSKLLWEPDLDLDQLLEEYYRLWFGPAADAMKNFFHYAEHVSGRSGKRSLASGGQLKENDLPVWFELLAGAKAKTRPGTLYRKRIEALEQSFEPLKNVFRDRIPRGPQITGNILPYQTKCDGDLSKYRSWSVFPGTTKKERTEYALAASEDRSRLFLAFRCYEPAMPELKPAVLLPDDPALFAGDHLRIDFNTPSKSGFTVAVNPGGSFFDSASDPESVAQNGSSRSWNPDCTEVRVKRFSDRWEAEVAIPLWNCGPVPDFADAWGIHFTRVRKTRGKEIRYTSVPGAERNPSRWHQLTLPKTDSKGRLFAASYYIQEKLPDCPDENVYIVKRAAGPVDLSAPWNGGCWKDIREVRLGWELVKIPGSGDFRPDARVKMQYDDKFLYVLYQVRDRYVRGGLKKDQSMVCLDSCMEFFVQPDRNGPYYNFECNCIGTLLLYEIRKQDGRLNMKRVPQEELNRIERFSTLPRTLSGELEKPVIWRLGLRIPLDFFVRKGCLSLPLSGQVWYGNFYKCADWTSHPCWLTWKKTSGFHVPDEFGTLIFE